MLTSQQRYQSIQGLLMGIAIGDALAQPRAGRTSKSALRRIGKFRPLRYRMWSTGLYSANTQLALMTAQAMLQSRSTSDGFHGAFAKRFRWYALSLPPGLGFKSVIAGIKLWFRWRGVAVGMRDTSDSPATRSLLLGVALYNTGHRYQSWARDCAAASHDNALVIDAAAVLATAGQIAGVTSGGKLNKAAAIDLIIKACREPELKEAFIKLQPWIDSRLSPRKAAQQLGWQNSVPNHILPTTVLAIYCFLRYPTNYQHAVKSALLLGGQNETLVATVGGLVGAHIGVEGLPTELNNTLGDWPHNREWIEKLSTRLTDWPHGVEDLLQAPAQPSYAPLQLMRNVLRWPYVCFIKLLAWFR